MEGYMERIQWLKKIIEKSQYMVGLMGVKISSQCGCTNYRDEEDSYDIESKYGYSPDEIFSASFYNVRPAQFYEFYKRDMISNLGEISPGLMALQKLEEQGKLKSIITRDIFSLARRAGCKNVYELHGSVFDNRCPHCGRKYQIDYI